jgi:BirA family transcriptional regulator, biotin operon repressor / biotin---[acetyl-CoA-carboxylase] ligase
VHSDRLAWHTTHIATTTRRLETTASTQTEARRLIAAGKGDGLAVLAAEQHAGRGRFGREWFSPAGNLYLSLVLKPPQPLSFWPQFTMLAALAVASALESVPAGPVGLKWPNDVLLADRKVAGILAEVAGEYLILGIGVNVNAPVAERAAAATSIREVTGVPADLTSITSLIVEEIDAGYGRTLHGAHFDQMWAARLITLGRQVYVQTGQGRVEGWAENVMREGALVVRKSDGSQETFLAGDVSITSGISQTVT